MQCSVTSKAFGQPTPAGMSGESNEITSQRTPVLSPKLAQQYEANAQGKIRPKATPETDPKVMKTLKKKMANDTFKARLKANPAKFEEFKRRDAERKRAYRKAMTPEQKKASNEKAKLRNSASRARKKDLAKRTPPVPSAPSNSRQTTRAESKKLQEKRERNRLSQQKRRANMHPQKKRREREKNMAYYYACKARSSCNRTSTPVGYQPPLNGTTAPAASPPPPNTTNATPVSYQLPLNSTTAPAASLPPPNSNTTPVASPPQANSTTTPVTSLLQPDSTTAPVASLPQSNSSSGRVALCRLKQKIGQANMIVSIKGLIKNLLKKQPGAIESSGISYTSPSQSKPKKAQPFLSSKRDKKTVTARRLFQGSDQLSPYKRKSKKHEETVRNFYEDKASFVPGVQGVSKKLKAKKVLSKSIANLHREFLMEHGNLVSKATFFRHRPTHVKSFTKTPFRQCLCEVCLNPLLKMKVINKHLPEEKRVDSLKGLLKLTLCEGEKVECLERKCDKCGVSNIHTFLNGYEFEKSVRWQRWERVKKQDGSYRLDLILKEGNVQTIVKELKFEMKNLPMHDFVHRWQSRQFCSLSRDIPEAWAVVVLDFAENYLCQQQDQPQSAYFGYTQVTVHPCVIYYGCTCSLRKTLNWTFISDVLKHNADMVHVITQQILEHLVSLNIKKVVIFSDGCAAQYKSKLPFFHLQSYDHLDIDVERCFFGARHGKNPCDALGGVLKQAASRAVKSRQVIIQSAQDLYEFAKKELSISDVQCSESTIHMSRYYSLLKAEDIVETTVSLKTLKGTRSLHSFRPAPEGLLSRNLCCFCVACISGCNADCSNNYYVQPWKLSLKTSDLPTASSFKSCSTLSTGLLDEAFLEDIEGSWSSFKSYGLKKSSLPVDSDEASLPIDCEPQEVTIVEEVSDPSSLSCEKSREAFFRDLQSQMVSCETYDSLTKVVKTFAPGVARFTLPSIEPKSIVSVGGVVDSVAKELLPQGLDYLFPVLTVADGNCVPRSLSLHCFGDQDHHIEIRCRIISELVNNKFDYLSVDPDDLRLLVQLADTQLATPELTLQEEVMNIRRSGAYMGLWQLMAAANVLHCDLFSVYPPLGPEVYRNFFSRTVRAREKLFSHTLPLFWSATERHTEDMPADYWTANHVVPLMTISGPIEVTDADYS
ncbi:(S)-beta-bisabolene synthase [Plakobranchus ocellatus]|uniref:(S)-beta-bisabolene synthase n=1 Tax=Plakobranchus ocellatus TaxID=259542 RepID=A0AAV4DJZ1_9GAST|nr:(S)-beta-bisabolene synthase [Plakobranchus ocellatus]